MCGRSPSFIFFLPIQWFSNHPEVFQVNKSLDPLKAQAHKRNYFQQIRTINQDMHDGHVGTMNHFSIIRQRQTKTSPRHKLDSQTTGCFVGNMQMAAKIDIEKKHIHDISSFKQHCRLILILYILPKKKYVIDCFNPFMMCPFFNQPRAPCSPESLSSLRKWPHVPVTWKLPNGENTNHSMNFECWTETQMNMFWETKAESLT